MLYNNCWFVALLALSAKALGHGAGSHDYNKKQEYNEPIPEEFNGSWQRWHMLHEHELDEFTPEAFFQIHAVTKSPEILTKNDILRMYGLSRDEVVGLGDGMGNHDDSELVSPELKDKIINTVMDLMDSNKDGVISLDEWLDYSNKGGEFPDFGLGPGHEYNFEEEYEKHHWLKYHADNDPEVEIMHKEDIEHELLHHFHEIEHDDTPDEYDAGVIVRQKNTERRPILIKNIPTMFRNYV